MTVVIELLFRVSSPPLRNLLSSRKTLGSTTILSKLPRNLLHTGGMTMTVGYTLIAKYEIEMLYKTTRFWFTR